MIIINEKLLALFRAKPCCEYSGARSQGSLHPHHVFERGMGGASRLDHRLNLISLSPIVHRMVHDSNISRDALLAIVARREGLTPEQITAVIWALKRAAKGSDPAEVEAQALAELRAEVV